MRFLGGERKRSYNVSSNMLPLTILSTQQEKRNENAAQLIMIKEIANYYYTFDKKKYTPCIITILHAFSTNAKIMADIRMAAANNG